MLLAIAIAERYALSLPAAGHFEGIEQLYC